MTDDPLFDTLRRHPEDLELRAVFLDRLHDEGHPGAVFLELDAELVGLPRADRRHGPCEAELERQGMRLPLEWLLAVRERSATRYEVRMGRTAGDGRLVERGLRKPEADQLVSARPERWIRRDPLITRLMRLRWLVPPPWQFELPQPTENRTWSGRADPRQRSPVWSSPAVRDGDAVLLIDLGPRHDDVRERLRACTAMSKRFVEQLPDLLPMWVAPDGRTLSADLARSLSALGAVVRHVAPHCRYDTARLQGEGGVALQVTPTALEVLRPRRVSTPAGLVAGHERVARFPLRTRDLDGLRAALRRAREGGP